MNQTSTQFLLDYKVKNKFSMHTKHAGWFHNDCVSVFKRLREEEHSGSHWFVFNVNWCSLVMFYLFVCLVFFFTLCPECYSDFTAALNIPYSLADLFFICAFVSNCAWYSGETSAMCSVIYTLSCSSLFSPHTLFFKRLIVMFTTKSAKRMAVESVFRQWMFGLALHWNITLKHTSPSSHIP